MTKRSLRNPELRNYYEDRMSLRHSFALELRRLRYGRPGQKVFCLGFQKTGTTSLQYALSLLGYRVAGVFAANERISPQELKKRALGIAQYFDAFADNPWPMLYRDLDTAFPGSKFILTTRDPEEWYKSACKHFGERGSRLRELIYGAASPIGNRDLYLRRMANHVLDVRCFFSDRPGDLLEFDIARGDAWSELCGFLDKPIPTRDFPRLNTAAMRNVSAKKTGPLRND